MPKDAEISPKDWGTIILILNQGADLVRKMGQGAESIKQSIAGLAGVSAQGFDLAEVATHFKGLQSASGGVSGLGLDLKKAIENIKKAVRKSFEKRKRQQEDYFGLAEALTHGLEMTADRSANLLARSFDDMAQSLVKGNLDMGKALSGLGKSFGNLVINAMADSLIQQGAAKTAEGVAALVEGTEGAAELLATGAALSAAGGGMKSLAASYLAKGGLVTQPTLSVVGEGGQSEAVLPLDSLGMAQGALGGRSMPAMSMDFPGVRSVADIRNGQFRRQATAHFKAQLNAARA